VWRDLHEFVDHSGTEGHALYTTVVLALGTAAGRIAGQGLLGGWISSRVLERMYLPGFLASIADAPLPYRTIAGARGKIAQKRER